MHTNSIVRAVARVFLALFLTLACSGLQAQTTAFAYQGQLSDGGSAATGIYDMRFAIYDAGTNGNQVSGVRTNSATSVSNGLFTVALDFGNVFKCVFRRRHVAVHFHRFVQRRRRGEIADSIRQPRHADAV